MIWAIVMAAAKPWTYWFAPALLLTASVLVGVVAAGYYRHVAVPAFRWRLHEEQRRLAEMRRQPGSLHRLPAREASAPSAKAA